MEVKKELVDRTTLPVAKLPSQLIELSSSQSDSEFDSFLLSDEDDVTAAGSGYGETGEGNSRKRRKRKGDELGLVLPPGFLEPLPLSISSPLKAQPYLALPPATSNSLSGLTSRHFWKAGDYEKASVSDWASSGGMDHVRVHPRFLHSNATSHTWVLGAIAELLDNSMDEVRNGATYVTVDMAKNKTDGSRMLLIEDDGGGMTPEKMRHCMSLGYSAKSKIGDTIGQYGNGFKTSTMRLGADVIVFSRCHGGGGNERPTQSIGLLSYTFLTCTGKEDIVVPMLDYEIKEEGWSKMVRSSNSDWDLILDTVVHWSPFMSEKELLQQFYQMKGQGTRIIIYNLWEDDQGLLELDFDTDPHDIQIRGVNRDEKNIEMAQKYPNSRHFLTYQHSLRSYAAILYLRVPAGFRIILRGKDVEHHNIVNDMMMSQEVTYRPQPISGVTKNIDMVAVVAVGFVKDAKAHIDVQGFNVYNKNRLIKPFWRVWNPAGSDGRGVIGVLEANFVEPAHDKQGFERTSVLGRLEARLIQLQKSYWCSNCHKIGYAPRSKSAAREKGLSSQISEKTGGNKRGRSGLYNSVELRTNVGDKGYSYEKDDAINLRKQPNHSAIPYSDFSDDDDDDGRENKISRNQMKRQTPSKNMLGKGGYQKPTPTAATPPRATRKSNSQINGFDSKGSSPLNSQNAGEEENRILRERLKKKEVILSNLQRDLEAEKEKCKSLEAELQVLTSKYEDLKKEEESVIDLFSQERERYDQEQETLRQKLKVASNTIEQLRGNVSGQFEKKEVTPLVLT